MASYDDRDGGRFAAPFYNYQTPPSSAGSNPPARVYAEGGSIRAAIRAAGRVFTGQTHMDALARAAEKLPPDVYARVQGDADNRGFIDHRGRFLDRDQAGQYARDFGLLDKDAPDWTREPGAPLISEYLPYRNDQGYAAGGPARSPYERFIDGDDRDADMYGAMRRQAPLPVPHSWREMPNTGRSLKEAGRRLMNVDTSLEPEDLARIGANVSQFLAPDATRFTREMGPAGAPLDVANVVTSASGKLPALAIQGGLGIYDTLMHPSEDTGPETPQELPPEVGMRGYAEGGPLKFITGLARKFGAASEEAGKSVRDYTTLTGREALSYGKERTPLDRLPFEPGSQFSVTPSKRAIDYMTDQDEPFFSIHSHPVVSDLDTPAWKSMVGTGRISPTGASTIMKEGRAFGLAYPSVGDLQFLRGNSPDFHTMMIEGAGADNNRVSLSGNTDALNRGIDFMRGRVNTKDAGISDRIQDIHKDLGLRPSDRSPFSLFMNDALSRRGIDTSMDAAGQASNGMPYSDLLKNYRDALGTHMPESWESHGGPIEYHNEIGKVGKAIRTIRNSFGSLQGARMEQAADLANLDRYSMKGLLDTFSPTGEYRNSLYTTLPPYAFEDYAKQLPASAADKVPYPRFSHSMPGNEYRRMSRDDMTQDEYLNRLANHIQTKGMDEPPELWMYKNPDDMTAIEGHEGRHRMRAMDRMGDQSSLVRLNNVNPKEFGRDPVEDAVERMQQKYLPQGANTPILPEDLHEMQRPPLRLGSEAFARGGGVEYHADLGPVGKGLTTLLRDTVGKPNTVKLPGGFQMPAHPIKEFEDVAHKFATRYGNDYPITSYPKLDEDRARKIAQGYEDMRHDPSDPRVKRAYDALIDETMDQYRALEGTGAKFEFLKHGEGDPYAASPSLGYKDLVQNGRLKVFPTEQGYGTQTDISDNPLLKRVGRVGDLDNATANDAFRVVHDALGHFGPGNPFFRAPGEERAWLNHMRAYSPDAVPAATSETRGQNSWVNFGPQSAANKGASGADTVYADQKAGLLPDWMWDPNGSDVERHKDLGPVGQAIGRAAKYLIDPARESFPGIYKPSSELVSDARARLIADPGQEGNMYKLFGHTRNSLDELSQGNRDLDSIRPFLQPHPFNLSGTASSSPRALTNPNAGRLRSALSAGLSDPDIKLTRSWYEMSPLWDRMRELGTGDRAMTDLNNRTAVMSAGSDPKTEINRGFYANWLAKHGRLDDFVRYGGVPEHERLSGDFPEELMGLQGHAYHGTAQVPNLLDYENTGRLWPANHKVPTYAAATDPHFPYSDRPIADSHFNRILGFPDVSTATTDAVRRGVPSNTEYSDIVPWFSDKVAGRLGMRPRDAQALLWNLGGPQTGVRYIGPSKLEMISNHMADVAEKRGIHPEEARDLLLSGEIGGSSGGTRMPPRGATMSVPDMSGIHDAPYDFSQIPEPNARGGSVDDSMLGWKSMFFDSHGGEIGHGHFGSEI
jgi:hypothetical protein